METSEQSHSIYKRAERDLLQGQAVMGQGNGFRLKEGRFGSFTVMMVRSWHGCLKKLWMSHPWKCSRAGWGLEQPPGWKMSCPWHRCWNKGRPLGSFPIQTIL